MVSKPTSEALRRSFLILLVNLSMASCLHHASGPAPLSDLVSHESCIEGKRDYLASPYVTAGERVYMIGYQDGSFPDMGWHIPGEMGGIWDHPIKLMDGFTVSINGKCLPSASRFLNYPMANAHFYQTDSLEIERFQFIPDSLEGAVIEYQIFNPGKQRREILFEFTGMTDLLPVWLSDSLDIRDGYDMADYSDSLKGFIAHDSRNDWYVIFGSSRVPEAYTPNPVSCHPERKGSGINASLSYRLGIESHGSTLIRFYIAGSSEGRQHAINQFNLVSRDPAQWLEDKVNKYHRIGEVADIQLPDTVIRQMFTWLKYNIQWLIRDVPGIGKGLSAGLPDYPWWFGCDNEYALQGALCSGQVETAKSTILLLQRLSELHNGNGRVIHEVSTNGVVYNPGNLNETAQYAMLVWDYFQWTGDLELLKKNYPFINKGLAWLQSMDKDGNLCPEGPGMMEIAGLNTEMHDVAVYTQQAFEAASKMASVLGDTARKSAYEKEAGQLKNYINQEWWVENEHSFADLRTDRFKAIEIINSALDRATKLKKPWSAADLDSLKSLILKVKSKDTSGYVVYHNWVVNTPMETGIADSVKAIEALDTAEKFTNLFGMYVTGIDRDISSKYATVDSIRKKTFSYNGAVMTLPTGVQAVAECRYGRPEQALDYIEKLANSFSYALPGSTYEVSPDFGMMTQAWNIYGVAVPIVKYFFGINPDAFHKRAMIEPDFPASWPYARIHHLPAGDNWISMDFENTENGIHFIIKQENNNWEIFLKLHPARGAAISVNDQEQGWAGTNNTLTLRLTSRTNDIWIK